MVDITMGRKECFSYQRTNHAEDEEGWSSMSPLQIVLPAGVGKEQFAEYTQLRAHISAYKLKRRCDNLDLIFPPRAPCKTYHGQHRRK